MKWIIAIVAILFCVLIISFDRDSPAYDPLPFYSRSGRINKPIKIFTDTITPSTGNGYSMDISAAGFNTVLSVNAIAMRNTGTATSVSNVGVKSMSTTAIVFNSTEGNSSLINILGSNVLLGPSNAFASPAGLQLSITVIGY